MASNTFTINGKKYKAAPFDFNLACDLEDMGISLRGMCKKPMAAVRAYFAACTGADIEYAGKELEQHIIAGGSLEIVIEAMNAEMEKSDFFRSLTQTAEEETAENQSEEEAETE